MSLRVHTTGIFEERGQIPELDKHGHKSGKMAENSAVINRKVVLLDELVTMLETRRKMHQASGYHDRVDEIDNILKEFG